MAKIIILLIAFLINPVFASSPDCDSLNNKTWTSNHAVYNSRFFICTYNAIAHFSHQNENTTATIEFRKIKGTYLCDPEIRFQLNGTCSNKEGSDPIKLYDAAKEVMFRGYWAQPERIHLDSIFTMSSGTLNGSMGVYFTNS